MPRPYLRRTTQAYQAWFVALSFIIQGCSQPYRITMKSLGETDWEVLDGRIAEVDAVAISIQESLERAIEAIDGEQTSSSIGVSGQEAVAYYCDSAEAQMWDYSRNVLSLEDAVRRMDRQGVLAKEDEVRLRTLVASYRVTAGQMLGVLGKVRGAGEDALLGEPKLHVGDLATESDLETLVAALRERSQVGEK